MHGIFVRMALYAIVCKEIFHLWEMYDKKFCSTRWLVFLVYESQTG